VVQRVIYDFHARQLEHSIYDCFLFIIIGFDSTQPHSHGLGPYVFIPSANAEHTQHATTDVLLTDTLVPTLNGCAQRETWNLDGTIFMRGDRRSRTDLSPDAVGGNVLRAWRGSLEENTQIRHGA